jgi:hypothetical protein
MLLFKKIIIHHSFTKDGKTVSWGAIRRYHTQTLKWSDIGYHYGVELINNDYEILVGRPLSRSGAHTKGHNNDSIGICCVGNYDDHAPSQKMLNKLVQLLKDLMVIYNITKDNVKPHRDYSSKTCPGKKFDMNKLRSML